MATQVNIVIDACPSCGKPHTYTIVPDEEDTGLSMMTLEAMMKKLWGDADGSTGRREVTLTCPETNKMFVYTYDL